MRRLRSALSLFRPAIAGAEFVRLREELRWLTNQFGEARNLDVLLVRLQGESGAGLRAILQERRERAYDEVIAALGATRTRHLLLDLVAWIETGAWRRGKKARRPLMEFAADRLDGRWRKVRQQAQDLGSVDHEARHQFRIEIKKLRYAVEFLASLETEPAALRRQKKFRTALESLQEKLGTLNDLQTGHEVLGTVFAGEPERAAEAAAVLEASDQAGDEEKLIAQSTRHAKQLAGQASYWR
jgi:CHAD domain-containing protein